MIPTICMMEKKMMEFLKRRLKVRCMVQLTHVSFLSIVLDTIASELETTSYAPEVTSNRRICIHLNTHLLTQLLLEKRPCNVKTDRYFLDGKFSWNQLLTQLNILFPEVLLCNFICQASFNEVRYT